MKFFIPCQALKEESLMIYRITKSDFFNKLIYICVVLACLAPKYYDSVLRLPIGLRVSFYTVFVVATWFLFVRIVVVHKKIESYIFLVWLFFLIVNVWRVEQIGAWGYFVVWIVTALLFQQIVYFQANNETFNIIIKAVVDGLFIQLLLGLYEITTHRYLFEIGDVIFKSNRLYGNVAISMFRNLNDYATFVMTMCPFAVYKYFEQQGILKKVYYGAISLLSIFMLIRSESRAVVLTIIVLLAFLLYLNYKKSAQNKIVLSFACVIILFSFLLLPSLQQVVVNILEHNFINPESGSDSARINLIKNGLYFLFETYGFGVGAGNLVVWLGQKSVYDIGSLLFIHNWYVEILVTFGILFFLVYVVFHVKVLLNLYKKIDKTKVWSKNNTILISFLAFSIVCISSSSNFSAEWVWMYFSWISMYSLSLGKKIMGN